MERPLSWTPRYTKDLDNNGLVVDMGLALEALAQALKPLKYANLDEVPAFKGKITTTEFLCHYIWQQLHDTAKTTGLGDNGRVCRSKYSFESHVARGWYEADI